MKASASENEGKILAAIIRLALKGPLTVVRGKGESEQRGLLLKNADGQAEATRKMLEAAAQAGVLRTMNGKVVATPEGKAYLKRHLSGLEEGFTLQHGEHVRVPLSEGDSPRAVCINLDHSPLASLARLKDKAGCAFLPEEALSAGERLHADFTRGQLQPRITQTYEPNLASRAKGARGGMADLSDSAMAARTRVTKALEAIGPELSGVALDVCCFMKGLETVERERQWPARSAKLMLRTALLQLHRHYTPPSRAASMRHWGEDGYRPWL